MKPFLTVVCLVFACLLAVQVAEAGPCRSGSCSVGAAKGRPVRGVLRRLPVVRRFGR